jgi:hypothetical protein
MRILPFTTVVTLQGRRCLTNVALLLQVALRKILQMIDPHLSSEEASTYITCSKYAYDGQE